MLKIFAAFVLQRIFLIKLHNLRFKFSRCDGNESLWINDTRVNAFFPNDTHAILNSIHAIRNFTKILQSQQLLLFIESAVVRSGRLKFVTSIKLEKRKKNFVNIFILSCSNKPRQHFHQNFFRLFPRPQRRR